MTFDLITGLVGRRCDKGNLGSDAAGMGRRAEMGGRRTHDVLSRAGPSSNYTTPPPVSGELRRVELDHGDNVPPAIVRDLLHPSVLGQPHTPLRAWEAGGGRGGGCEGLRELW